MDHDRGDTNNLSIVLCFVHEERVPMTGNERGRAYHRDTVDGEASTQQRRRAGRL